ncbi:phosphoacetylglucosamine mutase PCM1 NDAI_0K02890 [Naumovozyma dairenensis CBS 421]|uniref:Phosphoacetylglucosamine mutase n=1 Tax=Naumovozyma dairenensis (strain ATCC 10597 / BCRC 20456 / CBS 421 / NBRC 0211 / NRRL Y-12639) TaxID=1071378 RepID=G0WI69_NAUDC|nr:hypothetical protein NDAI_0K02890 [Naumovozyma dairenensis CBS 421]CCD27480.1 hypothetical protein NDAI_0K02890 [Naumovozyma dairenensis CBS 421]
MSSFMNTNKDQLKSCFNEICQTKNYHYTYGTAGFRDNAKRLDTVMFTTGIVACLRSLTLQTSNKHSAIGVMVTASHNPPEDNGVKIIEPNGSMLLQEWEPKATQFANIAANESFDEFYQLLIDSIVTLENDLNIKQPPTLILGHDSRDSSPTLMNHIIKSATLIFNAKIINYNYVTTPQLHFLTNLTNTTGTAEEINYYDHFNKYLSQLQSLYPPFNLPFDNLIIDAANGIGAPQVEKLLFTKNKFPPLNIKNPIKIINNDSKNPNLLNMNCGADYVKTNQKLPQGIPKDIDANSTLFCSYDGDADRIVFYYIDPMTNNFNLLDGDKIATLFAKFFSNLLTIAKLNHILKLGVVQTAYANGSSTNYISSKLKVPVSCTKTGVKHLHHEAITKYDIGIYFEANGHGTVIFSDKFHSELTKLKESGSSREIKTLLLFSELINQTVGDAMSDMLAVIAVLSILQLSPNSWDKEYKDLPNKLAKVIVPDRSKFITTDQERKLVEPKGLQPLLEEAVASVSLGRSFVRASGTEDAVRVYAEAKTQEETEWLSKKVCQLVIESVTQG